jgi:hypothetical protein
MKKLIVLFVILSLGCEKERCFTCTAVCTSQGHTVTTTQVYCGQYTNAEAKDMASSMTTTGSGIDCRVVCKEE